LYAMSISMYIAMSSKINPFIQRFYMTRKISFLSYKGGVGKTSLAVNAATCLAQEGNRVLLVDLDTQANASIWLLGLNRWNRINASGVGGLYSIFNPGDATLADCVVHDAVRNIDGERTLPGLDLVPTGFDLVDLQGDIEAGNPELPPFTIFQEQLEALEKDYDFVLFDCPPDTLRASQCGIFCCNEIYVPANADTLSLIGFTLLGEKLQKIHWATAGYRKAGMGPVAGIRGVIFNGVNNEADMEIAEMRMRVRLNQFRSLKQASLQARIFKSRIRYSKIVERAVSVGLPVLLMGIRENEDEEIRSDYRNLATELLELEHTVPAATEPAQPSAAGF